MLRVVCLLVFSFSLAACTSPAEKTAQNINNKAEEICKAGNQAACNTIVQVLGSERIGIESTSTVDTLAKDCKAGNETECQQLAAIHAELSAWCSTGNTRACAEVQSDVWPKNWDEPALLDAARVKCLNGKFKKDSPTCHALDDM
jgi:hypothetical protein